MIDAVKLGTTQNQAGKVFDQAQIFIGGIMFTADLTPHIERIAGRIAKESGVELIERRQK